MTADIIVNVWNLDWVDRNASVVDLNFSNFESSKNIFGDEEAVTVEFLSEG